MIFTEVLLFQGRKTATTTTPWSTWIAASRDCARLQAERFKYHLLHFFQLIFLCSSRFHFSFCFHSLLYLFNWEKNKTKQSEWKKITKNVSIRFCCCCSPSGSFKWLTGELKNKHGPHQTAENFLVVKIYLLAHSSLAMVWSGMAWHGTVQGTSESDRMLRLPCAKDGTQSINMTQSSAELTRLCFSHTRAQTQLSDLSVCFTLVKYLWRWARQISIDRRLRVCMCVLLLYRL